MTTTARAVVALGLALGFLLSGCAPRDTRPESTESEFLREARTLPGVESIDSTGPDREPVPPGSVEITLDTAATEAELTETGDALHDMLQNRRYPGDAPSVLVVSGKFTGFYGRDIHYSPEAFGKSSGVAAADLPLELLPYLHGLPDVRSGGLGESSGDAPGEAHVTVDGPVQPWIADRLAAPHDVVLHATAHTPADDRSAPEGAPGDVAAQDPSLDGAAPETTPAEGSEEHPPRITVDLSHPGTAHSFSELVRALGPEAEILGATITETFSDRDPMVEGLVVATPSAEEIAAVHDRLLAAYGPEDLPLVEARSATGLTATFDSDTAGDVGAYFDTARAFTELGIDVNRVGTDRGHLALTVPDGERLTALLEHIGSDAWQLPADTAISLQNPAMAAAADAIDPESAASHPQSDHTVRRAADELESVAPLVTGLWDAGFLIEFFLEDYAGHDHGLELAASETQDLTSPESRSDLISVLREHGWDGTAHIRLDAGDAGFLRFESAADGTVIAHHYEHDDPGGRPAGWRPDFVEEWNASAG